MIKFYIKLLKTPQTGLLLFTSIAGYLASSGQLSVELVILAMVGMVLAIGGATALNMSFDEDIDAKMNRTKNRPIPKGILTSKKALIFGWLLIIIGMIISYWIQPLYSLIVAFGVFFNYIIYTLWLKRRSALSIIFGGLAGGMPILAGRVLATGSIDLIGILMSLGILFWIPTHILSLAMNHSEDYKIAGVPTIPNKFGFTRTRYFITTANIIAVLIFLYICVMLEISKTGIVILLFGSVVLIATSLIIIFKPSERANFYLFKFASLYMVIAMIIMMMK
ncbi:MAG: protoheme IX farnesyltransferase [Candidatus Cloacimonetes bacterium]|nr:protoheme IX farnesyltransferase [Candidatus Cloacimonadota bacterium]MBT4332152.1 protoheme IX farnesyltransferase [Candidatus Cloacimonadota bacterium]